MLIIELLVHLYEWSQSHLSGVTDNKSEKERHVERIAAWADQHYTEKITLDYMAEQLN